jgi:3-oxoadipate enol-lactonase
MADTVQSSVERVVIRDGAIAVRRSGDAQKPRVLFIHSLALDGSIWDGVVQSLAEEAETLAVDCRGHGLSSKTAGPYIVEGFSDDIAEVMDRLGWSTAVVVGCSMGGCVAQALTRRHAKKVAALALIDTTAWYGANAPEEWRKRGEKAKSEGLASMADFQATRWFGDRFRETQPQLVAKAMEIFIANDVRCYAAACEMLGRADLRSALPAFNIPAAVIVGEEDYATPIQSARELQGAIRDATLTVLPKARHLTPIECPQAIAAEVQTLIRRSVRTNG